MKKNNYSKILGVAFVVAVLAAIISGIYYAQIVVPQMDPSTAHHDTKPVMTDYTNSLYQFSFSYNKQYKFDASGTQQNYFPVGGVTVSDVSIPQSQFPKTNFGQAHITFAVASKSTQAQCQMYLYGTKPTKMTQTVMIGSDKYYTDGFKDAAAGTAYGTQIFRILHNGTCYEADETVGIAHIENYPTGSVDEVVQADVWNDLSSILMTFKFAK